MRNQFLDQRIATLTQKIGSPETAEGERLQLLREQQALKQQKRSTLTAQASR